MTPKLSVWNAVLFTRKEDKIMKTNQPRSLLTPKQEETVKEVQNDTRPEDH